MCADKLYTDRLMDDTSSKQLLKTKIAFLLSFTDVTLRFQQFLASG